MHELTLTKNILDMALRYAQKTDSQRVVTIVLRLGVLRDIKKEWIQHYFNYISKGTIAENAEILVMDDPIVCSCRDCAKEFEVEKESLANEEILCPNCSQQNYTLISGTKFLIEGIEVI
jgi:hydrogenase nickel incorporation protein HypA/HybF